MRLLDKLNTQSVLAILLCLNVIGLCWVALILRMEKPLEMLIMAAINLLSAAVGYYFGKSRNGKGIKPAP